MNIIALDNQTPHRFTMLPKLKKMFDATLQVVNINEPAEVSLEIVTLNEMRRLCTQYYPQKDVTDVLSFPADHASIKAVTGKLILGDIVIARELVIKQAIDYRHSLTREWLYLFGHSVLHLLGYDHTDMLSEQKMHKLVKSALGKIGVD